MKYLTDIEIRTLLNLGKTVEMFLGKESVNESINWIDMQRGPDSNFQLNIHSVFDDGDADHLDLCNFPSVDPDEMFTTINFETLDEALAHVKTAYGLNQLRFVNRGMIQEEYRLLKLNLRS
jgi:hypothetical protein